MWWLFNYRLCISDISTFLYYLAEIRAQPKTSDDVNGNWKLDPAIPDIKPGYLTVYGEGAIAYISGGCVLDWDYLKNRPKAYHNYIMAFVP